MTRQFQVALGNMPGPYPAFLRYLAEHGCYGVGNPDAMVARRVESLRTPSGASFADHSPDGCWLRILRRKVADGGTVTVMTDITEQAEAERDLAEKKAQFHLALDNMPGALVYTDEALDIENHEMQAIRMAELMRASAASLVLKWKKRGHALGFGVGIAGGFETIGTIGFEGRLDYGVIVTVTNLAARLCGEAKDGQILISPRNRTGSHEATRRLWPP